MITFGGRPPHLSATQFRSALRGSLLASAALLSPAIAGAQDVNAQDSAVLQEAEEDSAIVVTGSRVAGAGVDSPAPVTTIDADVFLQGTGRISIGDELAELPQFGPLSTRAASVGPTGGNAETGLNLLDLRNLGSSRTLVLVGGRRHVPAGQTTSQMDVNTVPAALLERVEVLTGGASSIYGADALAGVVNFVLRDDFTGVQMNGRAGLSDQGDAETYSIDLTAGTDFAGGRGNIAANIEYSRSERLDYVDRSFSSRQTTLQIPNPANGDAGGQDDGVPDFVTVQDLRLVQFSDGGTFTNFGPVANPVFLEFQPNGALAPADLGPSGALIPLVGPRTDGGSGLNTIRDETLLPSLERYGLNIIAHYDISDSVRAFVEAKAVRVTSEVRSGAPAQSVFVGFDNPFLDSASAATISGLVAPGAPGFVVNRYFAELGRRTVENERTTYRGVVGLKGDLSENTRFEISYGYGRTDADTFYSNNTILPRIGLGADAVIDTAGGLGTPGATVCRATLNAGGTPTGNASVDQCVPYNVFGDGNIGPEAIDYINTRTVARGVIDQHVVNGFVSTDTRNFLELPGGPVSIVVGGEYRSESTDFRPDPRDLVGDTVNAGIQPVSGSVDVLEGFGEVIVPILAGVPGAELLEARGSLRVADYDLDGVGTNLSWGVGLVYAPTPDIRLRGSFQRAVRAPNLNELFSPLTPQTFFTLDPCSFIGIAQGSEQRATNCEALGAPPGGIFVFPPSIVPGFQGGNPDLDVERGRTWTVGAVYTPNYIPRLSISLDYYDVRIEDAIFQPNPVSVLNLCVDGPSTDNPFCDAITRDPTTAELTGINLLFGNVSSLTAKGFDFDARYSFELAPESALSLRMLANYVTERDDFLNQLAPNFPTQELKTVGTPELRVNFNADFSYKRFSFGYTLRYSSSQFRTDPANVISVGGQPPQNPDIFAPEFLETGDLYIHDIVARYQVLDDAMLFVGIDNLTEPDLPPGIYGGGFGGANFDAVGRFFYGGLRVSF